MRDLCIWVLVQSNDLCDRNQLSTAAALAERLGRPLQRSASAGNIGDSPERKGRPVNGSVSPSGRSVASTSTAAPSEVRAPLQHTVLDSVILFLRRVST